MYLSTALKLASVFALALLIGCGERSHNEVDSQPQRESQEQAQNEVKQALAKRDINKHFFEAAGKDGLPPLPDLDKQPESLGEALNNLDMLRKYSQAYYKRYPPDKLKEGEPTVWDHEQEILKAMAAKAEELKGWGKPRIVPRGATPEIIIDGITITVNGAPLQIGMPYDQWALAIGGKPRCRVVDPDTICIWDDLGLTTLHSEQKRIVQLEVHLRLQKKEPWDGLVTTFPDGSPAPPPLDMYPHKPFPGYLSLDNFGIDSETKFWEVLKSDEKRNLRCGLLDCASPHGAFSKNANLYMDLNGGSEESTIRVITFAGDSEIDPGEDKPSASAH